MEKRNLGTSQALIPYLRTLMNGTTAWDQDPTIKLPSRSATAR
jgi:hypothetical protein